MITGLEYFRLRPAGEGQSVYGILVTTMTKLYQFQGNIANRLDERPLLQSIFHAYLNTKGEISQKNRIDQNNEFFHSKLKLFSS
jgi:hypothetical protein